MSGARRILLIIRAIEAGKILNPSAWNYDNLVGAIWLEDPGYSGYDNAPTGQVEVREPVQSDGGNYDNRA